MDKKGERKDVLQIGMHNSDQRYIESHTFSRDEAEGKHITHVSLPDFDPHQDVSTFSKNHHNAIVGQRLKHLRK
jgi:hypothetical protein